MPNVSYWTDIRKTPSVARCIGAFFSKKAHLFSVRAVILFHRSAHEFTARFLK
jgi:hypothetical protein